MTAGGCCQVAAGSRLPVCGCKLAVAGRAPVDAFEILSQPLADMAIGKGQSGRVSSRRDIMERQSTTVRLTGFLRCLSMDEVAVVERHLGDHIALTRAEPGCLSFAVTQTADPLVWRVEEAFADRAAFEEHQTRTRSSAWFAATSHIERDYAVSGVDAVKGAEVGDETDSGTGTGGSADAP